MEAPNGFPYFEFEMLEYDEGKEKSFPFCELAKHLHEMPCFNPIINPITLVFGR